MHTAPASPPTLQRPEVGPGPLQAKMRWPPLTYHALHLLGDVVLSIAVRGLGLYPWISRTLDTQLQARNQGAAATLVPARSKQTHLRPAATTWS